MIHEEMTVHKALVELKILDSRIDSEIGMATFVVPNKHSNTKIGGVSIEDFCKDATGQFKSIKTLINRRNAIKRAVTNSNATTIVKIGDKEYTVAEAIDMKNIGLTYISKLAQRLSSQLNRAKVVADDANGQKLTDAAMAMVSGVFQGKDTKNMDEDMKKVYNAYIEAHTTDLVDPIGAAKEVTDIQNYMDAFQSDVDSALSVSNATTTIVVDYETV